MTRPFFIFCLLLAISGCTSLPQASDQSTLSRSTETLVFPAAPETPRFYYERSLYSSADVIQLSDETKLMMSLKNELLPIENMIKPYGIAAHQGRLFVSDTVRRMVMAFDTVNHHYFAIGNDENSPGFLSLPIGLDVDQQGQLYVVDATSKRIVVYNRDGQFLRNLATSSADQAWFNKPAGLAVNKAGTRLYVVDTGGVSSSLHRVRVFDAQAGTHLFDIGSRGREPGNFNLPRDVAVAPDGSIYVVDGGNFRVQQFSESGEFIRSFGAAGRQSGQFSRPKEVSIDPNGNVYVVDAAFGNFQIFTPEGQLLMSLGSRSDQDAPAKYLLPSGITVDEDGRVYVVDQYFRKIDIFRPSAETLANMTYPAETDNRQLATTTDTTQQNSTAAAAIDTPIAPPQLAANSSAAATPSNQP